ncbi:Alcohol acetyltransferase [Fusarium piperis]|uniref:Alcohol acetyltransferase n=1 Tax=Fusarium piperis TaxID=1435070 RepID=A0A9W9BPC0_9HYPO|nr:Alcohol acetyltransferase [Fusarium piperis]
MVRFQRQKTSPDTKGKPKVIRRLGHIEKYQSTLHSLGLYHGCAISCRYVIPDALLASDQPIESTVETAFASAILRHPFFTVSRINDDSKKPSWIRLSQIDLNDLVEWRTVKDTESCDNVLQEVLEWQVNHSYTHLETRPPWRSVILKPANSKFVEIVFAWDHTAGDGKSGKIFHNSLLASLNAIADGKEVGPVLKDRVFKVPVTALTPPTHNVLKFPISLGYVLAQARDTIKGSPDGPDSPYVAAWAPIQKTPCTTRQLTIVVGKDALPHVLEACRQHKTTLTGLSHALILVSMATRIPKEKAPVFQSGTPVCFRRFDDYRNPKYSSLKLEQTVMNCVTYWSYKYDEGTVAKVRQQVSDLKSNPESKTDLEGIVWSVAASIRQGISEKIASGTKNDMFGLMKFVGDWRSYFKDMESKGKRAHDWEVSNLGVIDGGGDGQGDKWTVESAAFTQSAAVTDPALCLSFVAVKGEELVISCCWQIEVIDDGLAKGLLSDLEAWLNQLGRSGHVSFGAE